MSHYVTDQQVLFNELSDRKSRAGEIRRARDDYVKSQFGIEDFSRLVDRFFGGFCDSSASIGLLCRQIPSVTLEDVVCYFACKLLNLTPVTVSMARDRFVDKNPEKRCLLKQRVVHRSAKNRRICAVNRCLVTNMGCCNGHTLSSIRVDQDGAKTTLPDWHLQKRQRMFSSYPCIDIFLFLSECLTLSEHKPKRVFVTNEIGKEEEVAFDATLTDMRPPSSWYYPLVFTLFLDGSIVLLESYEDDPVSGGSFQAIHTLFQDTFRAVSHAVGIEPLVVKIPCSAAMYWYSQKFEESGLPNYNVVRAAVNGSTDLGVIFKELTQALMECL